jgi:hypothetical protein
MLLFTMSSVISPSLGLKFREDVEVRCEVLEVSELQPPF